MSGPLTHWAEKRRSLNEEIHICAIEIYVPGRRLILSGNGVNVGSRKEASGSRLFRLLPSKQWVGRSSRPRDASFKFGPFRPGFLPDFRQVNGSQLSDNPYQVNGSPHRLSTGPIMQFGAVFCKLCDLAVMSM